MKLFPRQKKKGDTSINFFFPFVFQTNHSRHFQRSRRPEIRGLWFEHARDTYLLAKYYVNRGSR